MSSGAREDEFQRVTVASLRCHLPARRGPAHSLLVSTVQHRVLVRCLSPASEGHERGQTLANQREKRPIDPSQRICGSRIDFNVQVDRKRVEGGWTFRLSECAVCGVLWARAGVVRAWDSTRGYGRWTTGARALLDRSWTTYPSYRPCSGRTIVIRRLHAPQFDGRRIALHIKDCPR